MSRDSIDREVAEQVMETSGGRLEAKQSPSEDWYVYDWLNLERWSPKDRMDHALEVVEKMREKGWKVSITSPGPRRVDWACDFFNDSTSNLGTAETLPLAICLAARMAAVKPQ